MKRTASRELDVFEEPYMSASSPHFKAALPKSTAARFSRLFDQQACLYIHKLTPLDLRSPAFAYLLEMGNLRRSFRSVLELAVARWRS